jgi:trigger factor
MVDVAESEPLAKGSIAVIDFVGYVDGEPFEGGAAQAYPLEIGSGSFVPGFEDGLIGAKVGEEKAIDVKFPGTYGGGLGGKDAVFKVTVKGHKRRDLPEVDDEFARKAAPLVGLKADDDFDLEALRTEISRRLLSAAERRIRQEWEEKVVAKVTALAELDVPEPMIERAVQSRREEFEDMFRRNGTTLEQYMSERELTEEALRENMRPGALEAVRRELVLEAVERKEGITASDQEVDERIKTFAQMRGEDVAVLRQRLEDNDGIEGIRDEITRRKVIDFLAEAQVPGPQQAAPAEEAGEAPVEAEEAEPAPSEPKAD